ncbi:response regulator [candidate division GN15 bacterium]|nr:response regulator [candidate division GN15 bacterium]
MQRQSILVVEDEEDIRELISYNLTREGYEVVAVESGEEALKAVKNKTPDLVLLDLMLPGVDGLEVCRKIKKDSGTSDVSVVIVTAKGEEADVVTGLELGADDYVIKPFSPRVLLARVRAVMRRKESPPVDEGETLEIHNMVIHPGRHEVAIDGKPVELTLTEFRMLHLLASRPGWVFTRYQIIEAVHGENYLVTDRSVDVQVVGLRKKLGSLGKMIETVRGIGYRFKE